MRDLSLGAVLAFLCPGVFGLIALSYHFPVLADIVWVAQQGDQSVGAFLFAGLLALSIGVAISGIRSFVVDELLFRCWLTRRTPKVHRPSPDLAFLRNPQLFAVFQGAVENYLRYYQFYANTLVAMIALAAARALDADPAPWPPWWPVFFLGSGILLLFSAGGSLRRYAEAVHSLHSVHKEASR